MTIYTRKNISKLYSDIVNNYLQQGYQLSVFTTDNDCLEKCYHCDLIKPNDNEHVYRLWLLRNNISDVEIVFKRYNLVKNQPTNLRYCVGDLIEKHHFYEVKCGWVNPWQNVYSDSVAEVEAIRKLRQKRKCCKPHMLLDEAKKEIDLDKISFSTYAKLMKHINNVRGFKRAKYDCITKIILSRSGSNRREATVFYNYNDKLGQFTLR